MHAVCVYVFVSCSGSLEQGGRHLLEKLQDGGVYTGLRAVATCTMCLPEISAMPKDTTHGCGRPQPLSTNNPKTEHTTPSK